MGEPMQKKSTRKPRITISRSDHDRLLGLANALEDRDPILADTMITELERARVVEDKAVPETVVRMGSTLTYTADDGAPSTVTLVYPGEADIAEGKVSVTTPVGTALIGLPLGQSIDWTARNGRTHRLTVTDIQQPKE
mgnify:CR=1 FL=1